MNIMCSLLVAIVYVIPVDVESYLPNSSNICYSFSIPILTYFAFAEIRITNTMS